ncbi:hypothetical protein GCM10010343_09950 [Streptomyces avidinii]|nr:hypothetical protein GCM10010343_09950 [Streptomyces avidinii]
MKTSTWWKRMAATLPGALGHEARARIRTRAGARRSQWGPATDGHTSGPAVSGYAAPVIRANTTTLLS